MNKKGFIITFEGIDGCGKTTISKMLESKLNEMGYKTLLTREPGGVESAEKIREIILNENIDGITEALLFASARRIHLKEKVIPALNEGKIVIIDRFIDSSLAYQGIGRNLGIDRILDLNMWVVENYMPYITFFLDVEPNIAFQRIQNRSNNRLDNENMEFYFKVREGFKILSERFSDRIVTINANNSPYMILKDCLNVINKKLP